MIITSCEIVSRFTVQVSFENIGDVSAFEKRLSLFGYNILEYSEDGNIITYKIKTTNIASRETLELMCYNYDIYVCDENYNEILTRSDIISISAAAVYFDIKVSSEFQENFINFF